MEQGHFYLHTSPVSKNKGGSAVKTAGYQANQCVTHYQQRLMTIELAVEGGATPLTVDFAHHKSLNKGVVSPELRDALAQGGIGLSQAATIEKRKGRHWTIRDGEQVYPVKGVSTAVTLPLVSRDPRRTQLKKGILSDELRADLQECGIHLSRRASVEAQGRREWTIRDGGRTITLREHEHKVMDETTGKRRTEGCVLDIYVDKRHDYRTKEDVKETWVQAPEDAPEWVRTLAAPGAQIAAKSRERLWNWAESGEVARDARVAQKLQISFVRQLMEIDGDGKLVSYEQSKALLQQFVQEQFVQSGQIVDVAIHAKTASDGLPNVHAHVLVMTRPVKDGERVANKDSQWDQGWKAPEQVKAWRAAWADKLNGALAEGGSDLTVDHRSYAAQGLDKMPQKHLGVAAASMERRGESTWLGRFNGKIRAFNADMQKWAVFARRLLPKAEPEHADDPAPGASPSWAGRTPRTALGSKPAEEAYHLAKIAALVRDESSGTSREAVRRMMQYGDELTARVGAQVEDLYTAWRARVAEPARARRERDFER